MWYIHQTAAELTALTVDKAAPLSWKEEECTEHGAALKGPVMNQAASRRRPSHVTKGGDFAQDSRDCVAATWYLDDYRLTASSSRCIRVIWPMREECQKPYLVSDTSKITSSHWLISWWWLSMAVLNWLGASSANLRAPRRNRCASHVACTSRRQWILKYFMPSARACHWGLGDQWVVGRLTNCSQELRLNWTIGHNPVQACEGLTASRDPVAAAI